MGKFKYDSFFEENDVGDVKTVLQYSQSLETQDLWKIYGIDTQAGKILHKVFMKNPYPKLDYPKPRPKPKLPPYVSPVKSKKTPKSQTIIEYPRVYPRKTTSLPQLYPIDTVGHKRNGEIIKREIEEYYKRPPIPYGGIGVNRENLIQKTQKKFEKKRGALPKLVELPIIPEEPSLKRDLDDSAKDRALARLPPNKIMFMDKKIARMERQMKEEEELERKKKNMTVDEEDRELENLYGMIENEIEERQEFLESINHLKEPELKTKIRNEIVERISELEKIIKLLHKKAK